MHTTEQKSGLRVATFKIDQADYDLLEEAAKQDDRSVSALLRLAVRDYLNSRLVENAA